MNFFRFFKSGCDDVKHIRMERTLESTIFEIVALFLLIATWILAILMYRHAPESIPTHFDLEGNPNNEGSRLMLLVVAGISTILTVFQLVTAYVPTAVVDKRIKFNNRLQLTYASRMVRINSLLICLMFICIILMMCYPQSIMPKVLLFVFVGIICVVSIVFYILIKKARIK